MSNLPQTGRTLLANGQAVPETTVNDISYGLDSGFSRSIIEDRDLTAPPGTCADGARYLIKATATGAWAGQSGKLANALGVNASNGWQFITVAVEGFKLYVRDEDLEILYNGSAWTTTTGSGSITTAGFTMSTSRLLGRTTAATGAIEEISAGTGLSLTSGVLSVTSGIGGANVDLIEEKTPSGVGTVTFTSLGSGYKALRVAVFGRSTAVATTDNVWLQFNGDTTNVYDWQYSQSTGAANSTPSGLIATNHMIVGVLTGANAVADSPGQTVIDIPYPFDTTFQKSGHFYGGLLHTAATTGILDFHGNGRWRSTAALTSITVLLDTANFVAGTKIALYGYR